MYEVKQLIPGKPPSFKSRLCPVKSAAADSSEVSGGLSGGVPSGKQLRMNEPYWMEVFP